MFFFAYQILDSRPFDWMFFFAPRTCMPPSLWDTSNWQIWKSDSFGMKDLRYSYRPWRGMKGWCLDPKGLLSDTSWPSNWHALEDPGSYSWHTIGTPYALGPSWVYSRVFWRCSLLNLKSFSSGPELCQESIHVYLPMYIYPKNKNQLNVGKFAIQGSNAIF